MLVDQAVGLGNRGRLMICDYAPAQLGTKKVFKIMNGLPTTVQRGL